MDTPDYEQIAKDIQKVKDHLVDSNETKQLHADLEAAKAEIEQLKQYPEVDGDGFKTWWELALHVGAWKNHELDYVHFGSEMAVRAFAIHLLKQRDRYENELLEQLAAAKAEIEQLRAIISQEVIRAVEQEREACAALCEQRVEDAGQNDDWSNGWNGANYGAAAAIRGRGK